MPDGADSPIRIVIVDDHPVVRTGLAGMLASQPRYTVVGEAADGHQALAVIRTTRPDVVLMDLRMPLLDGADVIERLSAELPEINVLVLTTYDTDADILRAIEAGATGYLLKDTPREELFRAIEAAAIGQSWLTPAIATRLVTRVRTPIGEPISQRETEVLRLVARGASNKEIAASLFISEATVKSHLIHIFRKLNVDDRTAAVTVALERGLLTL